MKTSLLAVFVTLAAGSDLLAAIHTVSPGQSIQTVIDAAAPSDLIEILPGVYSENLTVAAAKGGLVIRGIGTTSQVVIDARPLAPAGSGPGFRVLAPGVTIENLTVRHARSATPLSGAGIDIAADGVILNDVVVLRSQNDGVAVVGNDFQANGCRFEGNGRGATVTGSNAQFVKCQAVRCGDRGLSVTGDGAVFEYNVVDSIEDGEGILVSGAGVKVRSNQIVRCALDGIKITGDTAVVEKNAVRATTDKGIRVSGSAFTVRQNHVADVIRGGDGIRVQNASSGIVTLNRVENCLENGIEVTSSTGVKVVRNQVRGCASEKEASIQVTSASIALEFNFVEGGQGDGIRITGDNNSVVGNVVIGCLEDGIDVNSGIGNTIDGNEIERCACEGLENNGTNTVCTGNAALRNRIDYANNGSFSVDSGNVYVTGGPTVAPQIDD